MEQIKLGYLGTLILDYSTTIEVLCRFVDLKFTKYNMSVLLSFFKLIIYYLGFENRISLIRKGLRWCDDHVKKTTLLFPNTC